MNRRALSVQKSRSDKTYVNEAPRQSVMNERNRSFTESKPRSLKPSKSLTETRFRTPEPAKLKKETSSKFNDMKKFLKNSLYDSNKSFSSKDNSLSKHIPIYTLADPKENKKSIGKEESRSKFRASRSSLHEKSLPIGVKIDLDEVLKSYIFSLISSKI